MATSSTRPADSHPRFLKLLTRFHKKSTHRNLLRTLMYKTQKKSSTTEPPRTTTNGHKFPTNSRVSHSSLCKSKKNFTKPMPPLDPSTPDLQNPGKSTPKVLPRAPKLGHDLSNDPRPNPSNLCKPAHNFTKLTLQGSSTALD